MIAHEQRPALAGDVVPAIHPDAIDGVREHPENETQQRVGQEPHDVNGRGQSHERADEEHATRAQLQGGGDDVITTRGQEYPHPREPTGRPQNRPFLLLGGPMLENGGNGNDKEAAEEPERAENGQELEKAQAGLPEPGSEDREAQRAQRHQAILDLAAGQVTGGNAPQPDANRHGCPKPHGVHLIKHQNGLAVIKHPQLHKRREEEEIGVAQTGQPEHPIGPHHSNLRPHVA